MVSWPNKLAASPGLRFARRYAAWIIVAVTVFCALMIRWRLRDMPLERDEGEYAYIGQLMLHGVAPYKAVYTQKLPGTPAAYALFMAVFGQSPAGIHVGVALMTAASIVLVFLLGRRLLDNLTGAVSAISFALLVMNPWVLGLAGHATHFVVFAALAGILLLLGACDAADGTRAWEPAWARRFKVLSILCQPLLLFFASGLLFGIGFLMKQHGIFFGLFGGIYLLWRRIGDWLTGRVTVVPLRSDDSEGAPRGGSRSRAVIPSRRGRLRHDLRQPGRLQAEIIRTTRDAGVFAAGFALPYALTCLVLLSAGAFHEFVFWTITYASKYSSAIPLVKGSDVAKAAVSAVIGPNLALWILPWAGALMMWWETRLDEGSKRIEASARRKNDVESPWSFSSTPAPGFHAQPSEGEEQDSGSSSRRVYYSHIRYPRFFLTSLLFFSMVSVSVGLYFRPHYFILLLPVMALLTGVAVSRGVYLLQHDRTIELFLALPILGLFVIAIGAALIGNGSTWLAMTPRQAMTSVYGTTLFSETVVVADYIRANSGPDAKIAVLGSEPQIYFYSGRRSATGYIYTYPLMELHPYALKLQEQMIKEIEEARPEYLIYVDDDYSWLARPDSERRIFEWWKEYWARDLELVNTIEFKEGLERGADADNLASEGISHARTPRSGTPGHILILKRRQKGP